MKEFDIPVKKVWIAVDAEGFARVDTIRYQKIEPTKEIIPIGWKWVNVIGLKID